MHELTLLRELGTDLDEASPGLTSAAALKARRRLLEQAFGPQVVRLRRRRRWPRIAVAAAAAAVVAGGVGLVQIVGVGDHVRATPAAAAALDAAAESTIHASDPVVGPDQYLEVTTRSSFLPGGPGSGEPGKDPLAGKLDHAMWRVEAMTETLYKPGDGAKEWVWHRSADVPVSYLRPGDKALWEGLGPDVAGLEPPQTLRALDGHFMHVGEGIDMQAGPVIVDWRSPDPAFLAQVPRDPELLLARIRSEVEHAGPSHDGAAFGAVTDILRGGYVPADLRVALFRAAALIPGVELIPGGVTIDGRHGTAVARTESSSGLRQDLVFDEATGQVLGERLVGTRRLGDIPAGTVQFSTAVTVEVVDSSAVTTVTVTA